jgi:hypothetical protein
MFCSWILNEDEHYWEGCEYLLNISILQKLCLTYIIKLHYFYPTFSPFVFYLPPELTGKLPLQAF